VVVGRERELALLTETVEAARHGSAGSVVVRGEPGIGKTALLDELVGLTAAAITLRTRGLEVEAPLAYAALHRLLRPLTRLRSQLPPPQARALRMAFGEEDGPAVEPFLIGIATLTVLTAAAEEQLVLCVVDDTHWLDPATADALLFCARRIGADRVVMMFATRGGAADRFEAQDLAEMTLTGLTPDAARELLDTQVGRARAEEVTQRLISETRGNPLALLELPTELSAAQLHGASPLPVHFHLTARMERVFLERSRSQPAQVQSFLLLAAAEDTGELAILKTAAANLGLTEQAWEAAVSSGLLEADTSTGVVAMRHPLVRSAIYQAATSAARRRTHLALADAFAAVGDADREVWQRSAAAEGPDDDVAAGLELIGSRAQRRGAHVSALASFERAAALCADPVRRAALTFAAARSAWACGQVGPARAFLATAEESATEPALLADIARLRGHIEVNLGSATLAHRIFVDTANAVRGDDPQRALEVGVLAATLRTYGADSGSRLPAADLVSAAAGDSARTRCLKQMLVAMTLTAEGNWFGAVEALNLALEIGQEVDDREVLWNLGNAALQLGDDEAQLRFYSLALSRAREAGAVTAVIYALQRLCFSHYLVGDLVAVRSDAEEALSLGSRLGPAVTAPPTAWLTLLAAIRGSDAYDELLPELEQAVSTSSLGILTDPVHDLTRWAKGIRAASTGDRSGALHHLSRFRLPALSRMAAVERFDAAVRAEESDRVRGWADELASFAEATGRAWAFATAAYGRAITAEGAPADALFQEALSQHSRAGRPLDQARVQLAYGEWLRRAQRRVDARRHLRHALETFGDAHAEALADRATQELRASGETARKRDPSTLVKLTPMELKIAQLVSSGLSNKDVAAQIWVSPRTVAFHLRNIFAKAGVTSRGALAQLDLA
jgi:DNA-binding CsgD family transcriptional regulator/tetratricopeptide (TPR) repeat protein